ncbi:hypothetical protein FHS29_004891 [Saccharothrix tamanrassetensis]|uniref:DUF1963 domain-containing protein n=1 Tax=Saccharothrix tamanrassetensis TaxID=1051531 RepID=A0A841CMX9_9PSEU|nr:hypothetical protein [Saccharothrix tamanrassetensis]MBB5958283.1 hypothetical protein [Saccharothrix tamanrassetensis]
MTRIMIYDGPAAEDAAITRTGGLPLLPADVEWPRCAACKGNMQFLARIQQDGTFVDEHGEPTGDRRVVQVFMCENDPGMCETWEAHSGANAVIVLPPDPAPVRQAPPEGVTTLAEVSSVRLFETDVEPTEEFSHPYEAAREAWAEDPGKRGRDVLGQLGGSPSWLQSHRALGCRECAAPLRFVAQLEEGHDSGTTANYGGGSAYVHICPTHDQGAFLWQQ